VTINLQSRSAASVLLVCFIASVSTTFFAQGLIDALNFGQILKGRYPFYEIIFTALLSISLTLYSYFSVHKNRFATWVFVVLSLIAAYASSLVAFYLLPIFGNDGWHRVLQLPRSTSEWVAIVWSPLVIFAWLVGSIAGSVLLLMLKKIPQHILIASGCVLILGGLLLTRRFSLFSLVFAGSRWR
jgi:hypothetical protein